MCVCFLFFIFYFSFLIYFCDVLLFDRSIFFYMFILTLRLGERPSFVRDQQKNMHARTHAPMCTYACVMLFFILDFFCLGLAYASGVDCARGGESNCHESTLWRLHVCGGVCTCVWGEGVECVSLLVSCLCMCFVVAHVCVEQANGLRADRTTPNK